MIAANLSGQTTPTQRAPDHAAYAFGEAEGHQLPFVFAADQRVVGLMRNVARPAVAIGSGKSFHQVPAGEIGAAGVTDFPAANQHVKGAQSFFGWSERIETMKLEKIDVIGLQTAKAAFDRIDQMKARGANVVRAGA